MSLLASDPLEDHPIPTGQVARDVKAASAPMDEAAPAKTDAASAPSDKAAPFKAPPDLIFTASGACIVVGEVLPHGSAIMGRVCAGRPGKLDPINNTWVAVEGPVELAVKQLDVACVRAHRSKPSLGWSFVKEDPRVEIEVMQRIVDAGGHPNVLGVRDVIEDERHLSLVLDYCSGGDLMSLLAESGGQGLPELTVCDFTGQLIGALRFLHAPPVSHAHRDVSLENILLCGPAPWHLRLADFGLAAPFEEEADEAAAPIGGGRAAAVRAPGIGARAGRLVRRDDACSVGKARYVAPEVYAPGVCLWGCDPLAPYDGEAADVWSLGVCVLALLYGQFLWQAPVPRGHPYFTHLLRGGTMAGQLTAWGWDSRVSPEALSFVSLLLRPNPRDRPSLEDAAAHPWFERWRRGDSAAVPLAAR